jgi:hypothetical protein
MRLPNFVVIGAPKCGTTSLYYYLGRHPDVYLPRRKELHYFSSEQMVRLVGGPGDAYIVSMICRTRKDYESFYSGVQDERAIGDISPSYFYFPEASERIRDELGSPRIVVLVRDPIEKAFSQYMHLIRDNRETLEFFDALKAEGQRIAEGWAALWRYAESSIYTPRIQKYLDVFGEDRVRIIRFEELTSSRHATLEELFRFLEVDPGFRPDVSMTYNRSGKPRLRFLADLIAKPNPVTSAARRLLPEAVTTSVKNVLRDLNTGRKAELDERSRAYLRDYFMDDVAKLAGLVGTRLDWLD